MVEQKGNMSQEDLSNMARWYELFLPLVSSLAEGLFYIKLHSVLLYFVSVNLNQKSMGVKGNLCICVTLI